MVLAAVVSERRTAAVDTGCEVTQGKRPFALCHEWDLPPSCELGRVGVRMERNRVVVLLFTALVARATGQATVGQSGFGPIPRTDVDGGM